MDIVAITRVVKNLEQTFEKYNISEVGNMPEEKEEGKCRTLLCRFNNASTRETREVKMSAVQLLNKT